MLEHFDNYAFMASMPGSIQQLENSNSNTNSNMILYLTIGLGVGIVVGFIVKQEIDKKHALKLLSENDTLKKE